MVGLMKPPGGTGGCSRGHAKRSVQIPPSRVGSHPSRCLASSGGSCPLEVKCGSGCCCWVPRQDSSSNIRNLLWFWGVHLGQLDLRKLRSASSLSTFQDGRFWFLMGLASSFCGYAVPKSGPTLGDRAGGSRPGFSALHSLPEFAHSHVHWVDDASSFAPFL